MVVLVNDRGEDAMMNPRKCEIKACIDIVRRPVSLGSGGEVEAFERAMHLQWARR